MSSKECPFKALDFLELRDEWYKKLAESGFEDIEDTKGKLKYADKFRNSRIRTERRQANEKYFAAARQLLHNHTFKKANDKEVWELHAEGLSVRKIAEKLKIHKTTVDRKIHRIRKIMQS